MDTITARHPRSRILLVTNETARGDELHNVVLEHAARGHPAHVLVVAPALNSRLRHLFSDDAAARRGAIERVLDCVERLTRAGVSAEGAIGDPDPVQAIEDALGSFRADRVIVATHPEGRSNWMARNLVERAERRFDLPITHIVVNTATSVEKLVERPGVAA
jgi:hypothetical protein